MRVGIIGKGLAGVVTALVFKKHFPEAEVEMFYDSKQSTEPVGSGSWPNILDLLDGVVDKHPSFYPTWWNNEWDATPKTGILYKGWGKTDEWFHDFGLNRFAMHFDPQKFCNTICDSGLFKVTEKRVTPDDIDADYVYDCGGSPSNYDDYITLKNPLNRVLLAELPPTMGNVTGTIATPHGWCFVIPLKNRTSLGYLFNSDITSDRTAVRDFRKEFGVGKILDRRSFKNYCAKTPTDGRTFLNGNKYFFIEPMEASSVTGYLVWLEKTLRYINGEAELDTIVEENQQLIKENANFLLYHYVHGSKYNSPFWEYAQTLTVDDQKLHDKIEVGDFCTWKSIRNYSYYSFLSLMVTHHKLVGNDYESILAEKWVDNVV